MPRELRHNLLIQCCSDRFFERLSMDYVDLVGLPPPEERIKILPAYDKEVGQIMDKLGKDLSCMGLSVGYTNDLNTLTGFSCK